MPDANRVLSDLIRRQDRQTAAARELVGLDPVYTPPAAVLQWMPRTRGVWTFASVDDNGDVYDISGQGRTLTNNSAVGFGVDGLVPFGNFVQASSQYLSRPHETALNPTGSMWVAGWFRFAAASMGVTTGLISKYVSAGNQRAYRLFKNASDVLAFSISVDGITDTTVSTTGVAVSQDVWYGIVATFEISARLTLFVNGRKYENTTSIPASIFNATGADLEIGRTNAGNYLGGRAALAALGGAILADTTAANWFQQTRWAFGT